MVMATAALQQVTARTATSLYNQDKVKNPKVEGKVGQQQQRPKGEQGEQKSRPPQPRPQQQRPTIKKDNNPP
jgi:hypothetical protein